jgi:glycosyltransferase involved in cell wall biosynthesis
MAMPLHQKGYRVNIITNRYPLVFNGLYDTIFVYETQNHLWNALKAIDPFTDIYHAHNEPNWFVSAVKETSHKPVILDFHDSFLLRRKRSDKERYRVIAEERNNAFLADGFCFPCVPMKNEVFNEFKAIKDKPNVVLWSYVPRQFYRWDFFEWLGGICYQGRVDHPDIAKSEKYNFFMYCEYSELASEFAKRGIPFHLYGVKDKIVKWYQKRNLIAGGGVFPFETLLQQLGSHDWGLIGNIGKHRAWEYAMPNKLFEYIAAQLPIVALNAGHAGKWIEKEGIGINIKTLDELEERWNEHEKARNILAKKRLDYCMEEHIHKLEGLYEQILCG